MRDCLIQLLITMSNIPKAAQCARLKTAIAFEEGNIQGKSERFIAESDDYLIRRIPSGQYDTTQGVNPRKVRYSTAPIEDTEYVDLLNEGVHEGTMDSRNCAGNAEEFDATVDNRGAFGCNIPGTGIHAGFDEFTRVLQGKAWETDPACVLDLVLKEHYNEYIDMLRNDLPMRAKEQFEYSLERNVVALARYNTAVVDGFTHAQGEFPARPTGVLDLGTVRRVSALLKAQGWTGMMEVGPISEEAFETMRANYKAKEGVELQSTLDSSETRFVSEDVQSIVWGNIRWIISENPLRGYLVPIVGGGFKFVPVRPVLARRGTGGGLVTDINDDYFGCSVFCDGKRHDLYEVGFYVHPSAATREGFAVPQVAGKKFDKNMFNFMVTMLGGNDIECNRDRFKFAFRILHAYAFESMWPERMGAIIYRVSPDSVNAVLPTCEDECAPPAGDEIEMAQPDNPVHDSCSEEDCDEAACDDIPTQTIDPVPTQAESCPDPQVGVMRLATCGPIITESDSGEVCVFIERAGGSLGAASVNFQTVNGTAVDGVDFTATSGTVNWADGENDRKKVCIAILPAGAGSLEFTFLLDTPVGAALADDADTGCAVTTIQIEAPCVPA